MTTNNEIKHLPEQRRFELDVDGETAFVSYRIRDGVYYLTYSEVPPKLRGGGIGRELVRKTFAYLRSHNIEAISVCSFIKAVQTREDL